MKLLIILIILIFIFLCVYNTNIDTFSGDKTTSSGNVSEHLWVESDDIELDIPKKEKNNIKLSWLKPFSLNVGEYFIVLERQEEPKIKKILIYKNTNTVINYYIGNLDNGTYKIYLFYKVFNDNGDVSAKKRTRKQNDHTILVDYKKTDIVYDKLVSKDNHINYEYNIIKDKLYEFNPNKDNYNINIY